MALVFDTALLNNVSIAVLSEHGNNVNSGTSHQDHWKIQVTWEESHLGNFRCIYPSCGFERYEQFLHKNLSSLFKKTAASRAREECARMKRQELEVFEFTVSYSLL
jgi:tubulin polyglutamylase TTLL6/13